MPERESESDVSRYAGILSAMGAEPRLRIMRCLLSVYPEGIVAGDIGTKLKLPSSTLSHHLDKLKHVKLVNVRRERTHLWYSANIDILQKLFGFLYTECCARNPEIQPEILLRLCS